MRLKAKSSKRNFLLVVITSLLVLSQLALEAQIAKISCIEPKVIALPLEESDSTEIHFKDHQNHTFWYKLNTNAATKISYQILPITSGSFKVELYEYEGASFCKLLVKEAVYPMSKSSSSTVKLRKNFAYYLGVTNIGENCGHELNIVEKTKRLSLRSSELGSDCANLQNYERPPPPEKKETSDKAIIGGLNLEGKAYNALTKGAINAELRFLEKGTDFELKTVAYRLKGYKVNLESGIKYKLKVISMGYVPIDTIVSIESNTNLDFMLKPVEKGEKFIIDNIYFYPNTFACKPESQDALESLKDYMLEHKRVKIEIQGHTNGNKDVKRVKNNRRTGEEWNFEGTAKELSKLRADKLKEYLVEQGINKKRILTTGKGGDEMIVPNPTDMKEAAKNIRVEIVIIEN